MKESKFSQKQSKTICPLAWNHFSLYTDSSLRICCNSGLSGHLKNNDGTPMKLNDISSINDLYNSEHMKQIRRNMLAGERPKECTECFKIEDFGGQSRRMSSLNNYKQNINFIDSFLGTKDDGGIVPKVQFLDISLSNVCNLKCIMCSPPHSTLMKEEFDQFSDNKQIGYDNSTYKGALSLKNNSSMFDLFSDEELESIEVILFSGGEPLIDIKHKAFLKKLISLKIASKITISYNTNMTYLSSDLLEIWNQFYKVDLNISVDAYGKLNEYIRKNSNWNQFEKNVQTVINHPKTLIRFQTTVQALNITELIPLYEWIQEVANLANSNEDHPKVERVPNQILMWGPAWLHIDVLPGNIKKFALLKLIEFFKRNKFFTEKSRHEIDNLLKFLRDSINRGQDEENFKDFISLIKRFEMSRKQDPIYTLIPSLEKYFIK